MLAGTTSVYHLQAPDEATYPYVVFNHQGGGPTALNPSRIEDNVWWIRSYSVTSALNAAQIFEQVDALLHRINVSITGATTIWCQRESNIALVETPVTGKPIFTCGGIYRIRTTST
jgi:hypothetical protein